MMAGATLYKLLIIYAVLLSCGEIVLQTAVDLEELVTGAAGIEISHDCGKFVCVRVVSCREYLSQREFDKPLPTLN